jgi:hypothetical protein
VHELLAGSGSTAMCGDDFGDNGNELINGLHGPTSLDYDTETAVAPPGSKALEHSSPTLRVGTLHVFTPRSNLRDPPRS